MEQVLLVVQVLLAVGLIGMVLIQRSDSDGFGLSGGSGNNLLSGRGAANAMTRITAIFAALFIMNSLALGVIAARSHAPSIAETIEKQQAADPSVPTVPLAGTKDEAKKAAEKPEAVKEEAPAVPTETKPEAPVKKMVDEAAPVKKIEKKAKKSDEFDPNAIEDHN